jgi:hypothetical protein
LYNLPNEREREREREREMDKTADNTNFLPLMWYTAQNLYMIDC